MISKPDIKAAINPAQDEGESLYLMEPMRISAESREIPGLTERAVELTERSAGFGGSLPTGIRKSLADLVRSMNCYYSNLIEGHDTHPVDIERALNNDFSSKPEERELQQEARAHIAVQQWIDDGGLKGSMTSVAGICEIHRRFGEMLPAGLLRAINPDTGDEIQVIPGKMRDCHVRVGRHIPVSPNTLPQFLDRFAEAYRSLGKAETLLTAAAAHHRLLWIHPFLDGNGRVARLMSYGMLSEVLETGGLWSIGRGLARKVDAYKRHLASCDLRRRHDLDGRGNLSEEELVAFTKFFLETCIDQVQFMEQLLQPERLADRIMQWVGEEIRLKSLPEKAERILDAILLRGELPRGQLPALLDVSERQARRIASALISAGVIVADSQRAPLRLGFPAALAGRWLPGLFPERN